MLSVELKNLQNIYFIGIGGIGMSALARWFQRNGFLVSGYDKTPTPLTDQLQSEGIKVHFEDNIKLIDQAILGNPLQTLVVYTPAIPPTHTELTYFKTNAFTLMKRSQVLGLITKGNFTVGVAGTHGKTTTSSMVAHILQYAERGCTAFLGGITQNYGTNLLLSEKPAEDSVVVVEADEFDRSFLTLFPTIAIVTSADPDHLDIYGDKQALQKSFADYIGQIKKNGSLIIKKGLELSYRVQDGVKISHFGQEEGAEYRAVNLRVEKHRSVFDLVAPEGVQIDGIRLQMPGFHNIDNATAAAASALQMGVPAEVIKAALECYKGVKRRFEYVVENDKVVYIDDYAHHPTEIEAFIRSVKTLYQGKKLTVIFQPHLYTRTRDFAEGFAQTLSMADELILLDIYPARELPIEGVNSDMIFAQINCPKKVRCTLSEVLGLLKDWPIEVLATVGAGDIDTLVKPIGDLFTKEC
ncbi:UDP-N-acetylmuramate--alanine ligase [Flexibacter flexilis DSM 6793]|uniref:UDP-N-acetylmuramate--L-alanine ligase n=1 Tax=Flexibacter flexilis DSM 6793 TaxID=927664 RepID=A0A1I1M4N3_9BACT|nr:UDP-N-acetylmuramate--L-alanine ligase [Flexibacter flexilis]SFC80006.1 UDP-N-acetylmuramate--alanine ligase [Flexibacter flexilis DSM 6793]